MHNKNVSSAENTPNNDNPDDKSKPAPAGDKPVTPPAKTPTEVVPEPKS